MSQSIMNKQLQVLWPDRMGHSIVTTVSKLAWLPSGYHTFSFNGANIINLFHCVSDFILLFPSFRLPTVYLLSLCSSLATKFCYPCTGMKEWQWRHEFLLPKSKREHRHKKMVCLSGCQNYSQNTNTSNKLAIKRRLSSVTESSQPAGWNKAVMLHWHIVFFV